MYSTNCADDVLYQRCPGDQGSVCRTPPGASLPVTAFNSLTSDSIACFTPNRLSTSRNAAIAAVTLADCSNHPTDSVGEIQFRSRRKIITGGRHIFQLGHERTPGDYCLCTYRPWPMRRGCALLKGGFTDQLHRLSYSRQP